jgi:hypothetical protein
VNRDSTPVSAVTLDNVVLCSAAVNASARFCSRAAAVIEVVIREGSASGHPHMFMSCVLYAVVDEVLV